MDQEVNYKNKRRYKTAKYPIRQPIYLTWLIQVLSKIMLTGKDYKLEKINMEGVKPPYILLSNHMYFVDFQLSALATFPHRVNNVVNIDGFYMRAWLLEWIGAICTRKFTTDFHLVKSIRRVIKNGDILCMYPEARYSPCGTTSYLPESLGAMVKMNKVPVVVAIHRGNYLHQPFWNFRHKRKVPLHTTLTLTLTAEDVAKMTVDEINEVLKKAFEYDDYRYQKDNGILITESYRAEGLHKILYKCPKCMAESRIRSEGAELIYTVKNGDTAVAEGDIVLAVNPKDGKTGETTLSFVAPTEIQYAGTYTGSATFTIAVKDVPVTIINFTFNGESYQAEEGMTLCQWAESEYDVNDEYYDAGDGSVARVNGSWGFIDDAVIVDGEEYLMLG